MRGSDEGSGQLFSYVDLEARVRRDHRCGRSGRSPTRRLAPWRRISPALFEGWPASIPPERLLRAMLLQAFYSVARNGS